MEILRQWLLGVVGCAFLVSFACQAAPVGAVREILRFAGGLTLILCMLRPLGGVELDASAFDLSAWSDERSTLEEEYGVALSGELGAVIAERTGAYIEDKADALGFAVTAQVEVRERGGTILPYAAVLHGERSEALAALMEAELGIPCERQEWRAAE